MERLLRVEEVSKNFAGIQAVSGLSVSLEKGRIA
ncbi:MAG TPA: ABC transporter ATP-binding protein, partial [Candidatus Rokubacteria bacterium]|nr:ABC transporter ATP-binding protein [Candidatus Rokubacteria bacterium]